jgi:adenylosuccinate lyase
MVDDDDQNAQKQILELQPELQPIRASMFDTYQTSLTTRYCSVAMSTLFSQRSRHSIWRKLWLHLAEGERTLGVENITVEALDEMRAHLQVTDLDFEIARAEEKRRRHVRTV